MDRPLVFLSHSGEDTPDARALSRRLIAHGLDVWLDVERLTPGDRWGEKIEQGLRQATALVVYVGKSGVRHWVDQEVWVALDRSTKERDFRLIPVLGEGVNPEQLPLFLQQYHWLDLRAGWTNAGQFKALLEGATGTRAQGVSLLPPGKSPFRGLQFFDVEDSLLFFGRETEIQDLLNKLRTDSFLAVVGDSGSGKSSLVRAGLIPALHRGRFHDGKGWVESWRVAIVRPGDEPFGELAEGLPGLSPSMSEMEKKGFLKDLKEELATTRDGLRNAIASLVPHESKTRTLLVVDQFEELFTLNRGLDAETEKRQKEKRRAYLDSLFAAARLQTERPVHVLITLRADFYSHCWEHDELTSRMGKNQYNVQRVSAEHLRDAIEKPLALAGAKAQPGLVDALLNDVGDKSSNLPLLEHALSQLWDKRAGSEITYESYTQIGRLSGALEHHANQVLEDLGAENEALARRIFLHLTRVGDGKEDTDTKRRLRKADLIALTGGGNTTERVLQVLTDARLLISSGEVVTPKDGQGDPALESTKTEAQLEVSHEALIRDWPRLKKWVNESRDELLIERRLVEAATDWEEGKRDSSFLWSGSRLTGANEWVRRHQEEVLPLMRTFVDASNSFVDASNRRAKRRLYLIRGLVLMILLMAVSFMGWTTYQARQ